MWYSCGSGPSALLAEGSIAKGAIHLSLKRDRAVRVVWILVDDGSVASCVLTGCVGDLSSD